MDSNIFTDWVKKLDHEFETECRKVALIGHNYPAHPEVKDMN